MFLKSSLTSHNAEFFFGFEKQMVLQLINVLLKCPHKAVRQYIWVQICPIFSFLLVFEKGVQKFEHSIRSSATLQGWKPLITSVMVHFSIVWVATYGYKILPNVRKNNFKHWPFTSYVAGRLTFWQQQSCP